MNRLEKLREKLFEAHYCSLECTCHQPELGACWYLLPEEDKARRSFGVGFDAAIAEYEEIIAELEHAIKNHHEVWGIGEECFSECSMLCKALQKLAEFRK